MAARPEPPRPPAGQPQPVGTAAAPLPRMALPRMAVPRLETALWAQSVHQAEQVEQVQRAEQAERVVQAEQVVQVVQAEWVTARSAVPAAPVGRSRSLRPLEMRRTAATRPGPARPT